MDAASWFTHQGKIKLMRYRGMSQVFLQAFSIIHFDSLIGKKKLKYKNRPLSNPLNAPQTANTNFFMDFVFMSASTSNFLQPDKKNNQAVLLYDGYLAYLLIVDKASWYALVFLTNNKHSPLDITDAFLAWFGHEPRNSICTD